MSHDFSSKFEAMFFPTMPLKCETLTNLIYKFTKEKKMFLNLSKNYLVRKIKVIFIQIIFYKQSTSSSNLRKHTGEKREHSVTICK